MLGSMSEKDRINYENFQRNQQEIMKAEAAKKKAQADQRKADEMLKQRLEEKRRAEAEQNKQHVEKV